MKRMTDDEIKKAFESLYAKLLDVKYDVKITQKEFVALNSVREVMGRQQAEIADLQDELTCYKETNEHLNNEYTVLSRECDRQKEEIEGLIAGQETLQKHIAELKSEVIKEFTEKIKESASHGWNKSIDEIAEELVNKTEHVCYDKSLDEKITAARRNSDMQKESEQKDKSVGSVVRDER